MSILVNKTELTFQQLQKLDSELNLSVTSGKPPITQNIQPYRIQDNLIFIPFAYGIKNNFKPMKHTKIRSEIKFCGELREQQKIVRDEMIKILNENNSIILSTHVGFGKSILASYFAYKIRMKTLIIINRLVLIKQWSEVLSTFLPDCKYQVLKSKELIDWNCDFFIVNAINIPKFGYIPEIGLVIVDEVHLIVSKVLSTCFQYITPSYLIGLSATPYRTDGLDILLDLYFGEHRINRQLQRTHIVYKVPTEFTPVVNRQRNGKMDWNDILNQQANDEKRNDIIVSVITDNPTLNFMVLCKRIEQIKILQKKLENKGIIAEYIYGNKQPDLEKKNRILIGTPQKLGTGFDAPWLNALIVASDLEAYFIQYLGRVFRKIDVVPFIFDFVDNNSVLKKHLNTRLNTYTKHGGIIR